MPLHSHTRHKVTQTVPFHKLCGKEHVKTSIKTSNCSLNQFDLHKKEPPPKGDTGSSLQRLDYLLKDGRQYRQITRLIYKEPTSSWWLIVAPFCSSSTQVSTLPFRAAACSGALSYTCTQTHWHYKIFLQELDFEERSRASKTIISINRYSIRWTQILILKSDAYAAAKYGWPHFFAHYHSDVMSHRATTILKTTTDKFFFCPNFLKAYWGTKAD